MRQQQGELLGRRQQDVGRLLDLPGALVGWRIAGSRLDTDGQPHLAHRGFEIAGDVGGKRLERRNIEGVKRCSLSPLFAPT